jgi:hypothetical protein
MSVTSVRSSVCNVNEVLYAFIAPALRDAYHCSLAGRDQQVRVKTNAYHTGNFAGKSTAPTPGPRPSLARNCPPDGLSGPLRLPQQALRLLQEPAGMGHRLLGLPPGEHVGRDAAW